MWLELFFLDLLLKFVCCAPHRQRTWYQCCSLCCNLNMKILRVQPFRLLRNCRSCGVSVFLWLLACSNLFALSVWRQEFPPARCLFQQPPHACHSYYLSSVRCPIFSTAANTASATLDYVYVSALSRMNDLLLAVEQSGPVRLCQTSQPLKVTS